MRLVSCCCFVILLFSVNSVCFSEEFVSFSKNNSHFEINVPSLQPSKVLKIENSKELKKRNLHNVSTFKELSDALDKATGGEVIVVRKSLRNQHFHYKQKHKYTRPVLILGMLENNKAPYLDDITWEHLHNVTISHFRINNQRAKTRFTYSWQIRRSNNVRLTNLYFSGNSNNLRALNNNDIGSVLNSQSGLLIKEAESIIIDRTLFTDLYHAVEFNHITSFYAVANKAVRVVSDMFSGGGLKYALFDSNLSHTRTPVFYRRKGKQQYVHSDMIQLYTTKTKQTNTSIIIRNNVSLVGSSPLTNPNLAGWQCFFTRDERGDSIWNRNMPYSNILIMNNICASNQHHGVTLSRGINNVIAGNFILLVDKGKTSREATGSIKVFENRGCKILGNVTHNFELRKLSDCEVTNNIHEYKPGYRKTVLKIKKEISEAKKRDIVALNSSSNDLSRFYIKNDLLGRPLQYLDYSELTLVPSF